jgi:membrane carboxypeptidase/penicillin-binding protein
MKEITVTVTLAMKVAVGLCIETNVRRNHQIEAVDSSDPGVEAVDSNAQVTGAQNMVASDHHIQEWEEAEVTLETAEMDAQSMVASDHHIQEWEEAEVTLETAEMDAQSMVASGHHILEEAEVTQNSPEEVEDVRIILLLAPIAKIIQQAQTVLQIRSIMTNWNERDLTHPRLEDLLR